MNSNAQLFDQIVKSRRSMRIFDAKAPFDSDAISRSLERSVLAPNSSNLQLWEFIHVKSPEMTAKFVPLCLSQKAAKTAREMVVFVCRKDKWKNRAAYLLAEFEELFKGKPLGKAEKSTLDYYSKIVHIVYTQGPFGILGHLKKLMLFFVGLRKPMYRNGSKSDIRVITHKSTALAAQTFMLSMEAEGYATCPMEGFDEVRVKKLLGLPSKAEINMIIACGPGTEEGVLTNRIRVSNQEVIRTI